MPIATPFYAIEQIAPEPLAGKLVIDANSYYPQHDSHSASEMLAKHLSGAKVVEALNAILERDARAVVASDRLALLIAGNDAVAKKIVSDLLDRLGFDVVDAGGSRARTANLQTSPRRALADAGADGGRRFVAKLAPRGVTHGHGNGDTASCHQGQKVTRRGHGGRGRSRHDTHNIVLVK